MTIPEYVCLFLMSFSLKQCFWNMVLGRSAEGRAEGRGLGLNGDWAGLQAEEPRPRLSDKPCLRMN